MKVLVTGRRYNSARRSMSGTADKPGSGTGRRRLNRPVLRSTGSRRGGSRYSYGQYRW